MASEKPVVATRVGSVGETVLNGRTGYLVAAGDSREMANRVIELLADRPRAAAMGRAGREHVIAHWSVDRMVRGYEDLIADVYRSKCPSPQATGGEASGKGRWSQPRPWRNVECRNPNDQWQKSLDVSRGVFPFLGHLNSGIHSTPLFRCGSWRAEARAVR